MRKNEPRTSKPVPHFEKAKLTDNVMIVGGGLPGPPSFFSYRSPYTFFERTSTHKWHLLVPVRAFTLRRRVRLSPLLLLFLRIGFGGPPLIITPG